MVYKQIDVLPTEIEQLQKRIDQNYVYDYNMALSCYNFFDYQ